MLGSYSRYRNISVQGGKMYCERGNSIRPNREEPWTWVKDENRPNSPAMSAVDELSSMEKTAAAEKHTSKAIPGTEPHAREADRDTWEKRKQMTGTPFKGKTATMERSDISRRIPLRITLKHH